MRSDDHESVKLDQNDMSLKNIRALLRLRPTYIVTVTVADQDSIEIEGQK